MRYSYTSPDTITNEVRLRGFLTEDASLLVVSPSGQAYLKLRLEVWLDERARRWRCAWGWRWSLLSCS